MDRLPPGSAHTIAEAIPGSWPVADRHAAMNLGYGQVPFVPHLLDEVIESVLVLREDQELHFRIVEDALLLEHFTQFPELRFDFALFEQKRLRDELIQLADLLFQRYWIYGDDRIFERGQDFLLLFFREIVEIVGNAPTVLPISSWSTPDPTAITSPTPSRPRV